MVADRRSLALVWATLVLLSGCSTSVAPGIAAPGASRRSPASIGPPRVPATDMPNRSLTPRIALNVSVSQI